MRCVCVFSNFYLIFGVLCFFHILFDFIIQQLSINIVHLGLLLAVSRTTVILFLFSFNIDGTIINS